MEIFDENKNAQIVFNSNLRRNAKMRKKHYTRNVGVLLNEDIYKQLIDITDKLEVTISGYIRDLVEKHLLNDKEKERNEHE
jgi:hypothetical protein